MVEGGSCRRRCAAGVVRSFLLANCVVCAWLRVPQNGIWYTGRGNQHTVERVLTTFLAVRPSELSSIHWLRSSYFWSPVRWLEYDNSISLKTNDLQHHIVGYIIPSCPGTLSKGLRGYKVTQRRWNGLVCQRTAFNLEGVVAGLFVDG